MVASCRQHATWLREIKFNNTDNVNTKKLQELLNRSLKYTDKYSISGMYIKHNASVKHLVPLDYILSHTTKKHAQGPLKCSVWSLLKSRGGICPGEISTDYFIFHFVLWLYFKILWVLRVMKCVSCVVNNFGNLEIPTYTMWVFSYVLAVVWCSLINYLWVLSIVERQDWWGW